MNNTITAVRGIYVGHWTDLKAATGCTVILCPNSATAGVAVRGGAPGTRETDLLRPETLIQKVHAIVLSGGSAFGLAAADGVVQWLEKHDIGFDVAITKVPIVPTAILFDLLIGRHDVRPDANAGRAACESSTSEPTAAGNVGAGTGATVGKLKGLQSAMKGGLGNASIRLCNGVLVGALAVVNCYGDVVNPNTGEIVAGARSLDGGWLNTAARLLEMRTLSQFGNTTLAVVATDAKLTQAECTAVANMAHAGMTHVVRPAHTLTDGDTIFVLSTGNKRVNASIIGTAAAEAVSQAILHAVNTAKTLHNIPARGAMAA